MSHLFRGCLIISQYTGICIRNGIFSFGENIVGIAIFSIQVMDRALTNQLAEVSPPMSRREFFGRLASGFAVGFFVGWGCLYMTRHNR